MNKILPFAATAEAATGLALMAVPSLVGRLLLGTALTGVAIPIARVTGIALLALGIACWPACKPLCGMLTYSMLATLYLAWLAVSGLWVGPLLWTAVAVHAILTFLLIRAWAVNQKVGITAADDQIGKPSK
jgi:hypothetical protein